MGILSFLKKKFSNNTKVENQDKYSVGMAKSRANFSSRLKALQKKYDVVNEEYFENLLQILIEADVGVTLTYSIIDATRIEAAEQNLSDPEAINELLVDKMFIGYLKQGEDIVNEINFVEGRPTVLLVVGVNGVGKTTSIAKLAHRYKLEGRKFY